MKGAASLYAASGRTQPNIWSCIFPAAVVNKSYALQVALIISERGAEICVCLGAGRSSANDATRAQGDQELRALQGKLTSAPPDVVRAVDSLLPSSVVYRRSWLQDPGPADFATLKEWLAYAEGPDGAQASISMYLEPEDLEKLGPQIGNVVREISRDAASLFEYCYPERRHSSPGDPATAAEQMGIAEAVRSDVTPRSIRSEEQAVLERSPREARHDRLDAGLLQEMAETVPYRLKLDPEVYRAVTAALNGGKHVILTGPSGTAKTTLAEVACLLARRAGWCPGRMLTTATADWTTYETIGGLLPAESGDGLEFRDGIFLEAIRQGDWLVIDELNRSNFDRAFGQLFTVLSGQSVLLPYRDRRSGRRIQLCPDQAAAAQDGTDLEVIAIPNTWRIIATMNVFDKSLLFEMSFALMRRFAFIEVPSPGPQDFAALWDRELAGLPDEQAGTAGQILADLLGLRAIKDIGPATFIDMARFAREYLTQDAAASSGQLAFQLFYSYLLPQYEGITQQQGQVLFSEVVKITGRGYRDRLARTLTEILGVTVTRKSADADADDFEATPPDAVEPERPGQA
jgi:MoxR-like ATPase